MCGDGWRQRNGGAACCDLCGAAAAVHCAADSAFLCSPCDGKVHGANFLASRHLRSLVAGGLAAKTLEVSCDHDSASSPPVSSSSCMSTADSSSTSAAPALRTRSRRRPRGSKRRARGELILEGWAKRMGLPTTAARRCAAASGRALRGVAAAARVPLRVAMAAALWHEVAASGAGRADTLQRLEACAHVPARIVVALATSMGRARETRRAAVEGWDECA